jgi:hypothetical protein
VPLLLQTVKLETRIPAGFLSGLAALIPDVAGINLEVSGWEGWTAVWGWYRHRWACAIECETAVLSLQNRKLFINLGRLHALCQALQTLGWVAC